MSGQQQPTANQPATHRRLPLGLIVVLLLAALARAGAVWHWRGDLSRDVDGYRAIAENLRAGHGFSADGERPTAFRPPLYPLFLAVALTGGVWTVAVLQVLLGVGTVWLTHRTGRNLGLDRAAVFAAALVAVEPLQLRYAPQLMTETVFTFLVSCQMSVVSCQWKDVVGQELSTVNCQLSTFDWKRAALVGFTFGLCALCRPTIWAFGGLGGLVWLGVNLKSALSRKRRLANAGVLIGASVLVVAPWVVRNAVVFGRPIVMTTHGGYTLLLGNNPVFYDEVVRQPWGTRWEQASLTRWQKTVARAPGETETDCDRRLFRRAVDNIAGDPSGFAGACAVRLHRFWSVLPLAEAGVPRLVLAAVALFNVVLFLGLFVGLYQLRQPEWRRWWPPVVLIFSFTAVHLVYWSNARMRAPVVPAIALLAIRGFVGKPTKREDE